MKGDAKFIETLNSLPADELTVINQYRVRSEMCANWGYGKLHEHFEKRAMTEMKHAEELMRAAASRNPKFQPTLPRPPAVKGYRRQAETAGGSVGAGSPGLSG